MNAAWYRLPWRIIVLIAVPAALALTIALTGSNQAVFLALRRASHVVPDALFPGFWESWTCMGDGLSAVVLATIFLRRRPDVTLAAIVAALPLTGLFTHGLRRLFPVDRPPFVLAAPDFTVLGPVLLHGSFPSGHSCTAAAFAGVAVLALRTDRARVLFVIGAILVAWSRVAIGVHWPIDVCTGLAGGALSAWIAWRLVAERSWASAPAMRVLLAVVLAGASIALMFYRMGLPDAVLVRFALAVIGLILSVQCLWLAARPARSEARD